MTEQPYRKRRRRSDTMTAWEIFGDRGGIKYIGEKEVI